MNSQTHSNTDRTSWSRIAMVWRFYLPFTRRKILVFAAIAIVCEILVWLTADLQSAEGTDFMTKMLSTMLTVIIACSALVFAKPKGRELQAMLPALGMEKCIVLIGYVTILIPLVVTVPSLITNWIFGPRHPSLVVADAMLGGKISAGVLLYSFFFLEGMALSCLWGVIATRSRRAMLNGLLAVGGFYLATMVIMGIISFGVGYFNALNGYEVTFEQYSDTLFSVLAVICGIYVIFALIKCCHAIKRGQY